MTPIKLKIKLTWHVVGNYKEKCIKTVTKYHFVTSVENSFHTPYSSNLLLSKNFTQVLQKTHYEEVEEIEGFLSGSLFYGFCSILLLHKGIHFWCWRVEYIFSVQLWSIQSWKSFELRVFDNGHLLHHDVKLNPQ